MARRPRPETWRVGDRPASAARPPAPPPRPRPPPRARRPSGMEWPWPAGSGGRETHTEPRLSYGRTSPAPRRADLDRGGVPPPPRGPPPIVACHALVPQEREREDQTTGARGRAAGRDHRAAEV